jgi:hypothetical protein
MFKEQQRKNSPWLGFKSGEVKTPHRLGENCAQRDEEKHSIGWEKIALESRKQKTLLGQEKSYRKRGEKRYRGSRKNAPREEKKCFKGGKKNASRAGRKKPSRGEEKNLSETKKN